VQRELKAVVSSTLTEAGAEAATVEWTVQDGEVRKPMTGGARSGEANTEPGVHTASVNEADGVSAGDVAEGGEPSETTGQTRRQSDREAARSTASRCSGRRGQVAAP